MRHSVFIHTGTVLTGLPGAKLDRLPACIAAPSYPRKHDSLSKGIKPSSSEDAPSTAGTFPNPGAKLASEMIVSLRKEILGLHFALDWGCCSGPEPLHEGVVGEVGPGAASLEMIIKGPHLG